MRSKWLMGSGFSGGQARHLCGSVDGALTATGTTITDALQLQADNNILTTVASGAGAKLPAGDIARADTFWVVNYGANALLLYPPTSAGQLNNGTAGASVSIPSTKSAYCLVTSADGLSFAVNISA